MFRVNNDDIEKLVDKEYDGAIKYGLTYNSDHEFYGILKEEMEEVKDELESAEETFDGLWQDIKDGFNTLGNIYYLEIDLQNVIKESLQCLAVIRKYTNKGEK